MLAFAKLTNKDVVFVVKVGKFTINGDAGTVDVVGASTNISFSLLQINK